MTFSGILTALVTPFAPDGALDEAAFRALVRRQLDAGVDGLVPCGTTGEAPTLELSEHAEVIRWCVDEARGRVPVMAGIGSNHTATAIATAKVAEEAGAAGVLATVPYYNKPTQEGLYRHFRAIAEAVGVEVCLYNVPGRTSVHMEPATVARLAEVDSITCIKEATGDMAVATEIRRLCGSRIALLSGDDFTTLPFMAVGGVGCISVASNLVPARMRALVRAAAAGRLSEARERHEALFPLFAALFLETNPIPVKTALAELGLVSDAFRLPLCPMGTEVRGRLRAVLLEQGLLHAEV